MYICVRGLGSSLWVGKSGVAQFRAQRFLLRTMLGIVVSNSFVGMFTAITL